MVDLPVEARAELIRRLRAAQAAGEPMTVLVRHAAAAVRVTERTVWRWLRRRGEPTGVSFRLGTDDIDAVIDAGGNIASAWRARLSGGAPVPSLRTFQRAVRGQLLPGEVATLLHGAEGRRAHEVYLRWEPEQRNAVWEADHKELPVLVLPPRGQRPQKPWVTLFFEGYSRAVMGWALSLYPSAATVLAALRTAILLDDEEGPFGGVPDVLRIDNGLEFAAEPLRNAAAVLGFRLVTLPPYTPHLRGKIERYHRTIDDSFIGGLPLHTSGPRAADGRLLGPAGAMSLALFVPQFGQWVRDYNLATPHTALSGETPAQRWGGDPTPLRTCAEDQLRWLLLASARRRVLKDGVHVGGLRFIAPELNGRVGQTVEVRHMPHDLRAVEIFVDGVWLATAKPQDLLTDEDREAILRRRREDARALGRLQRRASSRARRRLAPITAGGDIQETTTVSAAQSRQDRDPGDERLRKLGRTDLLGLERIRDLYKEGRD